MTAELEVSEPPRDPASLDSVGIHLVDSLEEACEFARWLGERRDVLAVDTESGGLSPWHNELRLVQFGDQDTGWSVPWHLWGGVAKEALQRYEGRLALHNAPHDWKWLKVAAGIELDWSRLDDTMVMAFLDNSSRSKALKTLCRMFFGNRAVVGQDSLNEAMRENKWTWATVPIDHPYYWGYGALDTVLTSRLHARLAPAVRSTFAGAYDLEMAAERVCTNMSVKGSLVDLEYCDRMSRKLTGWSREAREWCRRNFGVENTGSAAQLIQRFRSDGVEFHQYTDKGNIKLDKDVLEQLAQFHPLAHVVLKIRKAEKIVGTYLDNMVNLVDVNGRVHPSINTVGARTGRMSVSDPAFQTLHREDQTVRGAVIAADGYALGKCDAAQQEARLFAHFSEDPGFISAFSEGDFFCNVSGAVYGETIEKSDPRRALLKTTVYAMCYGSGTGTMARSAGVPYEQMVDTVAALHESFPGVPDFLRRVEELGKSRRPQPYIATSFGHRLMGDPGREYALVNYTIQGEAAAILKKNLVELDAAGIGDYMIMPVHDEIVTESPESEAAEVAKLKEEIMHDPSTYSVPMVWESEVLGHSWGKRAEPVQ